MDFIVNHTATATTAAVTAAATTSATTSSKKRVGHYELIKTIGTGAYANVYKGIDTRDNVLYAVKVIAKDKIGDPKLQENLNSEIHIMRDYNHPNIVRLFDHFSSSKYIYLVCELCEGGDLSKYIKKSKRIDEKTSQNFLCQLADGLNFLTQKNLIHRDLKPANVLLTEFSCNAILKLADFGFAKHLAEASMAQTPCGTPLYMCPEIFEMHEYDAKADLWSVGCIFFEMLTGLPPFKGSNTRDLLNNIKTKPLTVPNDVYISTESLTILKRLLERNPLRRASFDEFFGYCKDLNATAEETASSSLLLEASSTIYTNSNSNNNNNNNNGISISSTSSNAPLPTDPLSANLLNYQHNQQQQQQQYIGNKAPTEEAGIRSTYTTGITAPGTRTLNPNRPNPATATTIALTRGNSSTNATLQNNGNTSTTNIISNNANSAARIIGGSSSTSSSDSTASRRHSTGDMDTHATKEKLLDSVGNKVSPSIISTGIGKAIAFVMSSHETWKANSGSSGRETKSRSVSADATADCSLNQQIAYGNKSNTSSSGKTSTSKQQHHQQQVPSSLANSDEDFVIIDSLQSHPWRSTAYNNTNTNTNGYDSNSSSAAKATRVCAQQSLAAPSAVAPTDMIDGEILILNTHTQRCKYICDAFTAIVTVSDGMVVEAIQIEQQQLQLRTSSKVPVPPSAFSSNTPSTELTRRNSHDGQSQSLYAGAYSLYLHVLHLLRDTIARSLLLHESVKVATAMNYTAVLKKILIDLSKLYDQVISRADSCHSKLSLLSPVSSYPTPEPLIYKAAMNMAREASVEELLGNIDKAHSYYTSAQLLIESVMITATDMADRKVLSQFAQTFLDQQSICQSLSRIDRL